MQFTYPLILWALLLLLIPIFIHLLRLRKFKKTRFTNVKLLQKIVSESNRSHTLKKWLLLLARLGLLAAVILAFARPYTGITKETGPVETIYYIDNSFSMQAKGDQGTLLENAVQDFVGNCPPEQTFSLFTNDNTFEDVTLEDVRESLLALGYSTKQLTLEQILLKSNTLVKDHSATKKNVVLISDFQERLGPRPDSLPDFNTFFIRLHPDEALNNISVDSVYLTKEGLENLEVTAQLSANSTSGNVPISLFTGDRLIAKTSVGFNGDNMGEALFTIPAGTELDGRIEIMDGALTFDNTFYFAIPEKDRIKVLSVGENSDFLGRLFKGDEFEYVHNSLAGLNHSLIESQHLIVLNQLEHTPGSLIQLLEGFKKNGGSILIIPSGELLDDSHNRLLAMGNTRLLEKVENTSEVTDISFAHPIFVDVFDGKVTNFQYPTVNGYYKVQTSLPSLLSFPNGEPFALGAEGFYVFTAPLDTKNTNFTASPLIVPTFYNMARFSLKLPKLYHVLGRNEELDLPIQL
ncbi:MAG: BatA domain-containing protein, partial [Flavobacteriaceae bacterium]